MKKPGFHLRWSLLWALHWLLCATSWSHDSITTEVRQNYLAKLTETQQILVTTSSPAGKAKAHFLLGTTLDEIRDLFNQDIISHGAVKGLESTVLLNELSKAGFKMEMSPKIGLYVSQLQYYRQALKLDGKAAYADHARYLLLKNHFYDSFSDNPLKPFSQSREALMELIEIGEKLLKAKDPAVNPEEVKFILAIHYLQAMQQQWMAKDGGQKKFARLLSELRKEYPQSLKPMTLEALNP
jgi:hypothetical protein